MPHSTIDIKINRMSYSLWWLPELDVLKGVKRANNGIFQLFTVRMRNAFMRVRLLYMIVMFIAHQTPILIIPNFQHLSGSFFIGIYR